VVIAICIVASITLILAFQPQTQHQRQLISQHQQQKAAKVIDKLNATFDAIQQQVFNLSTLATLNANQSNALNTTLMGLLQASSPNEIYGMGVWFVRGQGPINSPLYGPYVHFDSHKQVRLTHEWMSENYDYPNRSWFKTIIAGKGVQRCTKPYWDNGLVFLTCGRAFPFGANEPKGIVTVDIILPQLENLISQSSTTNQEVVFISSGEQQLIAHPDAAALLKQAQQQQPELQSILDVPLSVALPSNPAQWLSFQQPMLMGWTVHVQSRKTWIENDLNELNQQLYFWLIFIWLAGTVTDAVWMYSTRRIRSALNSSLTWRNALSDVIPAGVFAANFNGEVTWANPVFCQLSQQFVFPSPLIDSIYLDDKPKFRIFWHRVCSEKRAMTSEFRLSASPKKWVLLRLVLALNDNQEPTAIAGILDDITARRRHEEELRHAKEQAEDANRSKGEFLAMMSHGNSHTHERRDWNVQPVARYRLV